MSYGPCDKCVYGCEPWSDHYLTRCTRHAPTVRPWDMRREPIFPTCPSGCGDFEARGEEEPK